MKVVVYVTLLVFGCASAQVTNIPCQFADTPRGYECRLPDVDLSIFNSFACVGGTHLQGRGNNDVVSFMSVNNNFPSFPTACMARFINLRHIKVSGSMIRELVAGEVINRPALETLSLSNNEITSVSPLAFTGTTNIQDLNLGFNLLRNIDNSFFQMFPNLLVLDMGFNLLERIPASSFIYNPSIMSLNLNANRISFVNQSFFDNISNLTTLQFNVNLCYSGSFFNVHLPANRFDMFMRLSQCFLEGPVDFRCIFGFEFGGIEFDGRYTCMLRSIEAFDKEKTISLGGFHMADRSNTDVTFVWIDSSDVRFFIRQLFQDFPNLYGVQIQSSGLEVLQAGSFDNAVNLRTLTVLLNNIQRLEGYTFQNATGLQLISFISNPIEYIHENAFYGLVNLRELHLIGASLNTIYPYTFVPLPNLYLVDISQNHIDIVDSRFFANNTNLSQINFNSNDIYAVHTSIVDMPNLTTLRLLDNVCVDAVFTITPENRETVRGELNPCIENYPLRRRNFTMELEGDLTVLDEDGTIVVVL